MFWHVRGERTRTPEPIQSSDSESTDSTSVEIDDYQCSICGNSGGKWVCCDTCDHWFHLKCVGVSACSVVDVDWHCSNCLN